MKDMKMKGLMLLAALTLVLASCSKEAASTDNGEAPVIRIEPVISKATSTNFENGDVIGLTVRRSDGTVHTENAGLAYSGNCFSSDLKWYADGGESCTISAYYPYREDGVPETFTVESDQSTGAGTSDFMVAYKEGVFPQSEAVLTVFRHQLTQLVITLDNKAGASVSDVTVKGVLPTVNVKAAGDGSLSVSTDEDAEPVSIKAETVEAGRKYRVIIAPQKRSFEIKVGVEGATILTGTDEADLLPGYTYSVGIEILPDMVNTTISGEIENWEDGGSIGGSVINESEAEEFEDYFIYRGKTYRTVILDGRKWMAEPMAYLPDGYEASEDPASGKIWYPYSSDGSAATPLTDDASVKALGYLYSYEAVFGTGFNDSNFNTFENAQGICPKGWHVPSRDEYFSLFGYSNRNEAAGETGPTTDRNALFWDAGKDYATMAKANEAGFNIVQSGAVTGSKYSTLLCTEKNCTAEDYYGKPAVNYLMTSTANKKSTTAYQMFAGMTTFTLAAYPEGRLTLAYSNHNYGIQLRCVKNL